MREVVTSKSKCNQENYLTVNIKLKSKVQSINAGKYFASI